ncbi:conserved hypothetical protein [Lebetimonas natsushimae]|uniref:Stringent starvation protein B n=1 Tax=Lebetimonas natsushimae TaxID=1936991 RepID=A0A292YCR1_9BACT|nr:hypothetical protein [Lebetimonas natsushimae]GAX87231.1 conserved hypothetical protein [Lebetimonas natsushimae]
MIIENSEFRGLKTKHAKELLSLLLEINEPFSILCNLDGIEFNPVLPKHISSAFKDVIIFALANYTLESAYIKDNILIFEAGFGEENFGSAVSVPIENIIQISEEETPLFINLSATLPKPKKPANPFAMNPRNKKFIDE